MSFKAKESDFQFFPIVIFLHACFSTFSANTGTTVGGYSNGTAGNASDALASPFGIVATDDGSLFVGEYRNARVTRLSANSLIGTIVAGTGDRR